MPTQANAIEGGYHLHSPRERGTPEPTGFVQEAERSEEQSCATALPGVSLGQERQSRVNDAELADMNYSSGLWTTGLPLAFCIRPWHDLGQGRYWLGV